jgi:hypothetical protein
MISTFFRADKLALATLFQSKEEERYYLNGVHIQASGNDGAVAVATDGHRMAVFHDVAGFTSAPCIVPLPKIAISIIRKRKTRQFCWFGIVGEHTGTGRHECRVFDTTDQASELDEVRERMLDPKDRGVIWNGALDLIDGTYPNWFEIMPKSVPKSGVSAAYNGKYLADFAAVAKDADLTIVEIYSNGKEPSIVTTGRDDFVGVIMPITMTNSPLAHGMREVSTPDWARVA